MAKIKRPQEREDEDADQPSFEAALEKLERIVGELEEGKLGLSQSLQRYEEGVECLQQCHQSLRAAERKIELLAGVDAEGNPIVAPFDEQAMSLEEKAQARGRRRSRKPADDAGNASDDDMDERPGLF